MNRANLSKDETEAFQGMFSLARAGLPVAAIYLDESFHAAEFQIEALDMIQSACVGPGRLAVVLPPKHGKTRLVQEAVSWLIGNNPGKSITLVSDFEYGPKSVDIPLIRASQCVRERITGSMRFAALWKVSLDRKVRNATHWETTAGGGLTAIRIGNTSRPCDYLFVDDPFSTFAKAQLASTREAVWQWFRTFCVTSVKPGGSVVLIGSRTHTDDLFGRLEKSVEPWEWYKRKAIE
jgi:hypothetical protein